VRLEPKDVSVSAVAKQLVRLPWDDPSQQCGALVCRIMLKACRRGRYRTIEAVAGVASKLRTQRAAGEVTIRVLDAVLDELRWTLDNPSFRDQQRMITYTRLLGELYCKSQVSGQVIIQQLHSFINVGHEIPESLREACKKLAKDTEEQDGMLPVYNSAGGVSQTIQEDEEMTDSDLVTKEETLSVQKPVAVSEHSKFDPRVPSLKDPPNSSYRITLVCAMLDVVARSLVSRNNLPKLRVFLASFQRYLFTKTFLPTDVEFAMLDCFDLVDSQWKRVCGRSGSGSEKLDDSENGFPRYSTWLDAHNATVAFEEAEAAFELQKQTKLELLADETKSVADFSDATSMNEEDLGSIMDEDEEDASVSLHSLESGVSIEEQEHVDVSVDHDTAIGEDGNTSDEDGDELEDSDDDEDDSDESEGESDSEDEEEEEEFDEAAYMRQLEEEAFERELRRMTMEALEKGKSASRKHVGDSMITGSQIIKKKPNEASKSVDTGAFPGTGVALGGEVGISFQVLKKGAKGKVEARELVVPKDTKLAQVATRQDDEKARERDVIKQRVLKYEEQSAEAEFSGGNVYLEQERLQINRNKTLSMEEIDKNFGTTGGNLLPEQIKKKPVTAGRFVAGRGGRATTGRGRGGRSSSSGRGLFGL
jgi:regulator of nonsense transcripts 2